MLKIFRATTSSILVWVLLVLLIVGLAGFGISFGGLSGNDVARVGDRGVSAQEYARALDLEIRAVSNQIGQPVSIEQARQFGLDRLALARLVSNAALDDEAGRLGLSSGDDTVREQLTVIPSFQGSNGFDMDAYSFALERMNVSASEFEDQLRREVTRSLISAAVQAPVEMPDTAALTVLAYMGEERSFDWLRLDESHLGTPVAEPSDSDLTAYHAENEARYTRPETRRISYAIADPARVAQSIDIPEEELRAAYDADPDRFGTPERRLLDRIGFGTEQEAVDAKAQIDSGESDFDAIASERGLDPGDTDQGAVAAAGLSAEARELVFGAEGPGVVGPVSTPLGPSLFRINAILNAQTVSFEEAREELFNEKAIGEATALIIDDIRAMEDLIAGGAALEELAAETVMELGSLELNVESRGELSTDPAFVELAQNAREGEETDLAELTGGGYVSLRLEGIDPPAPIPLEDIRERVAADWHDDEAAAALAEQAAGYITEMEGGLDIGELAERLEVEVASSEPLTRNGIVPGTPPRLVADIFAASEGGTVIVEDADGVILARLTAITPFDPEDSDAGELLDSISQQLSGQAAADAMNLFTGAIQNAAGVTVNQSLIDSTLARFQ